jgi:cell division protein ZapE
MVATSNTGSRDLYRDGAEPAAVHAVHQADRGAHGDPRARIGEGLPAGEAAWDARAEAAMDASFRKLTGRARGEPQTLRHKGRSIVVPQAALGVARFSFADLCATPLGPLDYQRIAHTYHTLIIEEIPVLGPEHATRPAVSSP